MANATRQHGSGHAAGERLASPVTVRALATQANIAIVTVDSPPVNALTPAVRLGLIEAADAIDRDPGIEAAILICAGSTFIAGADIREFARPPLLPATAEAAARIERSPKPWIAALHGTALGGGLEIALGCHYRIANPSTRLGFPEVDIGVIPGGGGSVRLPRLVPAHRALALIVEGKPIPAHEALTLGLIDRLAAGDLRAAAIALAGEVAKGPRPAPLTARPPLGSADDPQFIAAETRLRAKAGPLLARHAAIEAVRDALTLPAGEALARARESFGRLRQGEQSHALRHIFFAERSAQKIPGIEGVAPRRIEAVGIAGGGTMGAGIAAACLLADFPVTVLERDRAAVDRALAAIRAHLGESLRRGLIDETDHDRRLAALAGTTEVEDLSRADLVIEAVFEDMAIKQQIFARLDAVTRPEAVLVTNTSYLDVSAIARGIRDPSRVLGLHFFSPAHLMKLLEIVRPETAAPDVLATARALARRLGKIGVPAGVGDGFIGNRIMSAYRAECEAMLEEGGLPQEIDAALTGFGFPMGIFAVQDLAGLDIAWARRKAVAAPRHVTIADRLCELGRFGRKAGAGYYRYREGRQEIDPLVGDIIGELSRRKGIVRRPVSPEEIVGRTLAVMQSEGANVLAEGIAASPEAIDVVMVNGYGFPRWRGGPMYMRENRRQAAPGT